jgi:ribose transport system substrate-binding protein
MKKTIQATAATAIVLSLTSLVANAKPLPPLNPDTDPSRTQWWQLSKSLGTVPTPPKTTRIGAVAKTLTNEYWRQLGDGYQAEARKLGVTLQLQAAQSESDQLGQLAIAQNMLTKGYNALLLSPQTDSNLQPAVESAKRMSVPVLDVDDAVFPSAEHFIGNVQRDNGVLVARWFIKHHPQGGKVAVIEGMAGVFAAKQRTAGFEQTLKADNGKFQVVASVPGNWSRQKAYEEATTILQRHPDLIGFYANNDDMALGVVQAVKAAGQLGKVAVIGTDGIGEALKSIHAGQLTATVDSFPKLTGEIAVDVALRLLAHQTVPRVIETPQALITKEDFEHYFGSGVNLRDILRKEGQMETK